MRSTILSAVLLAALVALFAAGPPLSAQGCVNLTCNAGMCTVTATAPQGMVGSMTTYSGLGADLMASMNASCSPTYDFDGVGPTTFAVVLMGTATGAAPNSCLWSVNVIGGAAFSCSFTDADGLPVELLDFEVEPSSSSSTGEAAASEEPVVPESGASER
jgi:hypothetical protein